jgi:hypothetical protein
MLFEQVGLAAKAAGTAVAIYIVALNCNFHWLLSELVCHSYAVAWVRQNRMLNVCLIFH